MLQLKMPNFQYLPIKYILFMLSAFDTIKSTNCSKMLLTTFVSNKEKKINQKPSQMILLLPHFHK